MPCTALRDEGLKKYLKVEASNTGCILQPCPCQKCTRPVAPSAISRWAQSNRSAPHDHGYVLLFAVWNLRPLNSEQ